MSSPSREMAAENLITVPPTAWLLTRLQLERGGVARPRLRFLLGSSGPAILAFLTYWLAFYGFAQRFYPSNETGSSHSVFGSAMVVALICVAMSAVSLLSLTLILGSRSMTGGLLIFLGLSAVLYLVPPALFSVFYLPNSSGFHNRNTWEEFFRGLRISGWPFASWIYGLSMVAITLRSFSAKPLATQPNANNPSNSQLFGLPEAIILVPALTGAFAFISVLLSSSWGIMHLLMFVCTGIVSALTVYGYLRLLVFAVVKKISWVIRAVFVGIFILLFATSNHEFSQSYFTATAVILPILIGATILGADWLWCCGWSVTYSETSQPVRSPRGPATPAWQSIFLLANALLGCGLLWLGIRNQFAFAYYTVAYPYLAAAVSHFMLVYVIYRRAEWFWVPHSLVASIWLLIVALILKRQGELSWHLIPTVVWIVIATISVGHVLTLIGLLKRRRAWRAANQSNRFSLAESILLTSLLGAAIGLDVRAPVAAKQSLADQQQFYQRAEELVRQTQSDFVFAIQNDNPAALGAIQQKLEENSSALLRFEELFKHVDPRVQIEAVRLLGRIGEKSPYQSVTSADPLVAIFENASADIELRREALFTALVACHSSEHREILQAAAGRDNVAELTVAELTVEPCTRYLRLPRHREVGLGPIEVVVHLATLGPAAAACLPVLESFLEHPSTAALVPEVVRAIAKIGRHDSSATLQRAAESPHREIRNTAVDELKALSAGPTSDAAR